MAATFFARPTFCAAFCRFVVGGKRFSKAVRAFVFLILPPKYRFLVQKISASEERRLGPGSTLQIDLACAAQFTVFSNMSPRGKAKAKAETDENGRERRVRESRNVKAASYKDLSDSEEDRSTRKKKKESESESLSEEEKPKKRVTKGRRTSTRSKKDASDSEEASDFTEDSSDEDSRKKRKSARKPTRSLRAPQKTSYKDLSDSEEVSNEDEDGGSGSASEKEEKKSSSTGKRKTGRMPTSSKKRESSDLEDSSNKDESSAKTKLDQKAGSADSSSDSGAKVTSESSKKDPDTSGGKKERLEHDISEGEDSGDETEDKIEEKNVEDEGNNSQKRGRTEKKKDEENEKDSDEPQAKKIKAGDKPATNKTDSDYGSINFSSDAKTKQGDLWNFKISSWNVAGLKALVKKNGLDFIKHEKPDILCLQETKCSEKKLPSEAKIDGYHCYWLSGEKEGYAGVAILSKLKPLDIKYGVGKEEFDCDGRVITAEYDKFFLVNVYVPNAGQGLKTLPRRLEWDPVFRSYLKKLDEQKPVILCGDLNVAHSEIDLSNPKTNVKNAGFTPQERDGLTQLLKEGFVDTFRNLYPDRTGAYSFWTYLGNARSRNVGWRLDYFITSERFLPQVCDNVIRSEVYGSDHCPITLLINV